MRKLDHDLVMKIRRTAAENPHNPNINPMAPEVCVWEDIEFNGEVINIGLTYEYFTPELDKQCWHMSVSLNDHKTQASPQTTIMAVIAILGQGAMIEITEQMPPPFRFMRQFLREDDCYNPVTKEFKGL